MSKPANRKCKDFKYCSLMVNIAVQWESEKVDLKPVKQLITQYYYSDAIVTACDESNHAGFIEELMKRDEPVSLHLLEDIAKLIKSDDTLHLISQFRGTIDVSNKSRSTRCSMIKSDFSVKKFLEKLLKLGWKHKITLAILSALIVCLGFKWISFWCLITAAIAAIGANTDKYLAT